MQQSTLSYYKNETALKVIKTLKAPLKFFFYLVVKYIVKKKRAGGRVTEQEKLNYLFRTLPNLLSYIGNMIDTKQKEDRSCKFLKNKIKIWQKRNHSESSKNKTSAWKVGKKMGDVIYDGCDKHTCNKNKVHDLLFENNMKRSNSNFRVCSY